MKVAIAGYGIEGESSYRYYADRGDDVTIVDENSAPKRPLPDGANTILGEGSFSRLNGFDLVVRTAGLNPQVIRTDGTIWSATNEFFTRCPALIIGVTGTKGKGTTCSLIASILRASGRNVHLVGNIGTPALDTLSSIQPDDVVVYEMSSFQLWDIKMSPKIAVVLMIEQDHLDVHADMNEYLLAKSNIVKYQSSDDTVIYHPTNPNTAKVVEGALSHKVRYAIPDDQQVYVRDDLFFIQNRPICSVDAMQIPGAFNCENACAAISAALLAGASVDAVEAGLRSFAGLPHRLKFVREVNNVRYYDDSIATTPGSAIAALSAFTQPKVIILGGSDKGADYRTLIEACRGAEATVVAIGQTGGRIYDLCKELGVSVHRETGDMNAVVAAASSIAKENGVVILSPASASFDQYESYTDRGEQFTTAVGRL